MKNKAKKKMTSNRYQVRKYESDSISETSLGFASLDEAREVYDSWSKQARPSQTIQLIDRKCSKNWKLAELLSLIAN